MKIFISKYMMALACVMFLAITIAVIRLPMILIAKTTLILLATYFFSQFVKKYIFLLDHNSITHLNCDENHAWTLQTKGKQNIAVTLSDKSYVSVNWMFLMFSNKLTNKNYRVLLSTDSVAKNQWSLLHLLVKFAKPISKNK